MARNHVNFGDELSGLLIQLITHGARPDDAPSIVLLKNQYVSVKDAINLALDAWNNKGILNINGIDMQ